MIICPFVPKTSLFHVLVKDVPLAPKFLHSPQAMVFLLRQLGEFFISLQCNFSVFLGVKRETESNNKSHPCLERASGTTGRLQLPRPPPPFHCRCLLLHLLLLLLLLSSHALHPSCLLKACPAGPGCTCVVQQQRNRPKLLTALPLHFLPPSISTATTTTTSSSLPLHSALSFPAAPASCSVWTAASWKPATPVRLLLLSASRALRSQRAALRAVDLHVVTCQHGKNRYQGWGTSIPHRGGLIETRQTDRQVLYWRY